MPEIFYTLQDFCPTHVHHAHTYVCTRDKCIPEINDGKYEDDRLHVLQLVPLLFDCNGYELQLRAVPYDLFVSPALPLPPFFRCFGQNVTPPQMGGLKGVCAKRGRGFPQKAFSSSLSLHAS